jgi:hypothetical protein
LRPRVVMIDTRGHIHLIRERETLQSINQHESVPDHLKKFEL